MSSCSPRDCKPYTDRSLQDVGKWQQCPHPVLRRNGLECHHVLSTLKLLQRTCGRQRRESWGWVRQHVLELAITCDMQQTRFNAALSPSIRLGGNFSEYFWPAMRLKTCLLYMTDVRVRRITVHARDVTANFPRATVSTNVCDKPSVRFFKFSGK